MKKYFTLFSLSTFVFLTVFLSSCDPTPLYRGVELTKQEDVNLGVAKAAEYFDDTDLMFKIVYIPVSGDGVTKYAGHMHCYFFEKDNDTLQQLVLPLVAKDKSDAIFHTGNKVTGSTLSKKELNKRRENAVAFSDIDFSKIAKNTVDAGAVMVQLGVDSEAPIFFSGIGKYTINLDKDATKVKHEFTIESRDTVKSTKQRDIYYEYKFVTVGNGELEGPK